ncbi:MAG TPA: hypothetical protein VNU01_09220 [Egibacteraceae bacterium]|nr:hypothetical protein [Egibacteraceae bacterium]
MPEDIEQAWDGFLAQPGVALAIGGMLDTSELWLHRRVERLTLHSATVCNRHVSLDLSVPEDAPPLPWNSRQLLLPLTFLQKQPLTRFDLHDSSGGPVPVLTAGQNGELALTILSVMGEAVAGKELSRETQDQLSAVVAASGSPGSLDRVWDAFVDRVVDGPDAALFDHDGYLKLVEAFLEQFVLVAVLSEGPGVRTVLKFSYDTAFTLTEGENRLRRFRTRAGLRPAEVSFDVVSLLPASSTHVEVQEPEDVEVLATGALREAAEPRAGAGVAGPRRHLHLGRLGAGEAVQVNLQVVPARTGWMQGSRWSAWLAAFLLFGVYLRAPVLFHRGADDSASLLLAVTAVVVGLVTRPPAHAIAARLVAVRVRLVWLPPVALMLVAAVLVLEMQQTVGRALVGICAVAVSAVAVLLSLRPVRAH